MSIETFLQAMPKIELDLQFEGSLQKETLLIIADENEIPTTFKHYRQWVDLLDRPDYDRLDQLIRTIVQWIKQPEDLTRLVYDLGVSLAKQNIAYAEVAVNPFLYIENGFTFEQFLSALNDGRDRVDRAWKVKLAWILNLHRDQPRRSEDIIRWASSTAARKGNVVGIGLYGRENVQAIEEFERPFKTAQKKELSTVARVGDIFGGEEVLETVQRLLPGRIINGWGTADSPDVIGLMIQNHITLNTSVAHSLCMGHVKNYQEYPLRHLYSSGMSLTINSGMPSFYKTNLTQEYQAVVDHCGFNIKEVEELVLQSITASLLPEDDKISLTEQFNTRFALLHNEHQVPSETNISSS